MMQAKRITVFLAFIMLPVFFAAAGSGHAAQVCTAGQTQQCACPDTTSGSQTCMADGTGWQDCDCLWYSSWCDSMTGLCWQNPQKDAYADDNGGISSFDAERYCRELTFGGYDDWRLPTIDELRTIIRGAPLSRPGGLCGVREGSALGGTTFFDVLLCYGRFNPFRCGGSGGCCWDSAIIGTCDTVDPASTTHYLEYWSSSSAADDPDNWIGFVFFDTGTVGFNHALSFGEARCVRDAGTTPADACAEAAACEPGATRTCTCADEKAGAQVCSANAACWGPCQCTGFTSSPRPADVSESCDTVTVTVHVPKKLKKQPYSLMAFLYKYGEADMRPPDAGSYQNEIRIPPIDVDTPVTTIIPGCSYYRDRCMSGDYFLSVYLKMNEGKFPGPPQPADMVWSGAKLDPIRLTGDGTQHYEFDVTVAPIFRSGRQEGGIVE